MTQIEFYLPPPLTARDAAAMLGKLGGEAVARKRRAKIRAKARQLLREMDKPIPEALR